MAPEEICEKHQRSLDKLEQRFTETQGIVNEISLMQKAQRRSIDKIEKALLGDLDGEDTGFIPKTRFRLKDLERHRENIIKFNWVVLGAATAAIVSSIFSFILNG